MKYSHLTDLLKSLNESGINFSYSDDPFSSGLYLNGSLVFSCDARGAFSFLCGYIYSQSSK